MYKLFVRWIPVVNKIRFIICNWRLLWWNERINWTSSIHFDHNVTLLLTILSKTLRFLQSLNTDSLFSGFLQKSYFQCSAEVSAVFLLPVSSESLPSDPFLRSRSSFTDLRRSGRSSPSRSDFSVFSSDSALFISRYIKNTVTFLVLKMWNVN